MAKKTTRKQTARKPVLQRTRKTVAKKKAAKKKTTRKTSSTAPKRSAATKTRRTAPVKPKASRLSAAATAVRGRVASVIATIGANLPGRDSRPDAIQILERDHRRFEDLLKQGEATTERARTTRRELLATLTTELQAHELMEEEVLYPALKSHPQARDIVLEGYEEHHVADLIVKELHQVTTDDEKWGAKFKVLKESLEHHIAEEEGEMFKTARGIFSAEQLQALAGRMLALRRERS